MARNARVRQNRLQIALATPTAVAMRFQEFHLEFHRRQIVGEACGIRAYYEKYTIQQLVMQTLAQDTHYGHLLRTRHIGSTTVNRCLCLTKFFVLIERGRIKR